MSWVILILTFIVFVCSPNQQVLDSNYSMLLSEHLYRTGSCVLDDFFRRPLPAPKYPGSAAGRLPYQIREIAGHVVYFFPAGSAVLSIPFVAGMNALGISAIAGDQTYNAEDERRIQGWLAPLLMAVFSVLVFRSARLVLPAGWSALVAALGSQVWSTASRAVWSHTWGILLLATVLYLALRAETTGRRLPSVVCSRGCTSSGRLS